MRIFLSMFLAVAITAAFAAGTIRADETPAAKGTEYSIHLQDANHFKGMRAMDREGKDIGEIQTLLVNLDLNRVTFAVLDPDPSLNLENKYVPLPFPSFTVNEMPYGKVITVNETYEKIRQMPAFVRNEWPDMGHPRWCKETYRSWGLDYEGTMQRHMMRRGGGEGMGRGMEGGMTEGEKTEPMKTARTMSLEKIVGLHVKNPMGKMLGVIENFEVDLYEGHIPWAMVSLPAEENMMQTVADVPWNALMFKMRPAILELNTTPEILREVAYSKKNMPDLTSASVAARIYEKFNMEPYWMTYNYPIAKGRMPCAWLSDSDFNRKFNCKQMESFEGKVESVGCFRPSTIDQPGSRLTIQNEKSEIMTVYGGPLAFMEKHDVQFKPGDHIKAIGCIVMINGRRVMMARELHNGNKVIRLREDDGTPRWTVEESTKPGVSLY